MRADRLIAVLMLLQARGRVTAAEVATELEVSERTARRDLEALALSGVPIYSRHGRGGGWFLVGGARTDLTGLSAAEARALFLTAGPALAGTPRLADALRKLLVALPEPLRDEAQAATGAIKVDPTGWGRVGPGVESEHLAPLTDAVIAGRQVRLDYRRPGGPPRVRTVHPLGLVTKGGLWYLLGHTEEGVRTYRVSRVRGVEVTGDPVERPAGFDLDAEWERIVTGLEAHRVGVRIRALADPAILVALRHIFGANVVAGEAPNDDGRIEVVIADYNERSFAVQVAGFGDGLRLIDPPTAVATELARIGRELVSAHGSAADPEPGVDGSGR